MSATKHSNGHSSPAQALVAGSAAAQLLPPPLSFCIFPRYPPQTPSGQTPHHFPQGPGKTSFRPGHSPSLQRRGAQRLALPYSPGELLFPLPVCRQSSPFSTATADSTPFQYGVPSWISPAVSLCALATALYDRGVIPVKPAVLKALPVSHPSRAKSLPLHSTTKPWVP